MSLFEKIQNKRYNLQEAPIDDKGNITPEPGEIKKSEKIVKKFIKKQKKEKLSNQEISRRRSAQTTRGDAISRSMGTSGSTEGAGGANTGTTPPKPKVTTGKGVDQAEVSKQAQDFTKKINKERIVKQGNIFGGEDDVKTKRRVGSTTSRGTRNIKKKFIDRNYVPGQQKLNLGGDVTKKTPTPRLSKSGEVVTDLRTTGRKPRTARKRPSYTKPPKPEKMVVVKDPIKGGFKKVGATTTQGRKVLKKQFVSTSKLVDPTPQPKPSTTKPNLFGRIKNFVKGEPKIPGDYNVVRGTADQPLSVTRKVYKGKLGGVRKFVDKLPRKYKLAGTALLATAALAPNIKNPFAPKSQKKSYTVASKKLKLDTGKKNT